MTNNIIKAMNNLVKNLDSKKLTIKETKTTKENKGGTKIATNPKYEIKKINAERNISAEIRTYETELEILDSKYDLAIEKGDAEAAERFIEKASDLETKLAELYDIVPAPEDTKTLEDRITNLENKLAYLEKEEEKIDMAYGRACLLKLDDIAADAETKLVNLENRKAATEKEMKNLKNKLKEATTKNSVDFIITEEKEIEVAVNKCKATPKRAKSLSKEEKVAIGAQKLPEAKIPFDLQLLAAPSVAFEKAAKLVKTNRKKAIKLVEANLRYNASELDDDALTKALLEANKQKRRASSVDMDVTGIGLGKDVMKQFQEQTAAVRYSYNAIVDSITIKLNSKGEYRDQAHAFTVQGFGPSFKFFNIEEKEGQYKAEKRDDKTGEVQNTVVYRTGKKNCHSNNLVPFMTGFQKDEWNNYVRIPENIIMFKFEGFDAVKLEKYYQEQGVRGFYVTKESTDNIKVAHESLEDMEAFLAEESKKDDGRNHVIDGFYVHYIDSSSTLKGCSVLYRKLDCDFNDIVKANNESVYTDAYKDAINNIYDELDKLMAGALKANIDKLEHKRMNAKVGDEAVTPADFSKLLARVGLLGMTPSVEFGQIENLFIYDGKLEGPDEWKNKAPKEMIEILKSWGIDNFHADGNYYLAAKFVLSCFAKGSFFFNERMTLKAALGLLLQARADILTLKGLASISDKEEMQVRLFNIVNKAAKDGNLNKIHLYVNRGTQAHYTGEDLVKMSKDEMFDLFAEVDIFSTANENKAVAWDALNNGELPTLRIINAPVATTTNTSNQIWNKVLGKDVPKCKVVDGLTNKKYDIKENAFKAAEVLSKELVGEYLNKVSVPELNKELNGISNRPNDILMNAVPDAKNDMAIRANVVRSIVTAGSAALAKGRVKIDGRYVSLMPIDNYLALDIKCEFHELLGVREVEVVTEKGMAALQLDPNFKNATVKVKCFEVYDKGRNEELKHKIVEFKNNNAKHGQYSSELEAAIIRSMRVSFIGKYPTQGTNEFVFIYYKSNDEMKQSIDDFKYCDDETINEVHRKALKQYYFKMSNDAIILPASNIMKIACAGFDFDGDEGAFIPAAFRYALVNNEEVMFYGLIDGQVHYNNFDEVRKNICDSILSILLRKYEANGHKYFCDCIVYPDKAKAVYTTDYSNMISPVMYNKKSKVKVQQSDVAEYNDYLMDKNTLFSEVIRETGGKFIARDMVPNIPEPIFDIPRLYAISNSIGDDIGLTIALTGAVCNCNIFITDENGNRVFDYELYRTIFEPVGISKGVPRRYYSVFTKENGRVVECSDRFGVTWIFTKVDIDAINEFRSKVRRIPTNCTEAEWAQVAMDLNHIARALGESSIDCKKDVNKSFGITVDKLINKEFRTWGSIKNHKISVDYNVLTNEADMNRRFEYGLENFNNSFIVVDDPIGDIKIKTMKAIFETVINSEKDAMNDPETGANYDWYKDAIGAKANRPDSLLMNRFPLTAKVISSVIDYLQKLALPFVTQVKDDLTRQDKMAIRESIYGTAKLEGCAPTDIVKIALELCFKTPIDMRDVEAGKIKLNNDSQAEYTVGGFNAYYKGSLNTVVNFFKEFFIIERTAEYMNEDKVYSIPVELRLAADSRPAIVGREYNFTNGVANEDSEIYSLTPFTGKAVCVDNKIMNTDFYPLDEVENTEMVCFKISTDGFSNNDGEVDNDTFHEFMPDADGMPFGYIELTDRVRAKFSTFVSNDGIELLCLVDDNGNILALLDARISDLKENIVGSYLDNYVTIGYRYEGDEEKDRRKGEIKKEEYFNYFVSGTLVK